MTMLNPSDVGFAHYCKHRDSAQYLEQSKPKSPDEWMNETSLPCVLSLTTYFNMYKNPEHIFYSV